MHDTSSPKLVCAMVQADTRWADPAANRANLERLMDTAPGCNLYVLPETCTTGFLGDSGPSVESTGEDDLNWLRAEASRRSAAIAGSIVVAEGGRIFNRFLLVRPQGEVTGYDKRHLFGWGGEDSRYTAGTRRVRAQWLGWRIDLQICYDLRFPVWCRNDDAFDLQIFVANWPRPRVEAWSTLLRARAIENQAFVIGLNRVGIDGKGVEYPGRSGAWDALGTSILEADERERVDVVELDLDRLAELRRKFPFLSDRDRFELESD
ncbi:MAG: nitrilase-related carbon-nitrogen hydrolase [Wenzhouxiangellaceae bacterium]|nr:nitrilase-related carbon-nitrogen hydrolase [Wenzhouxiangellaceae bacterium]